MPCTAAHAWRTSAANRHATFLLFMAAAILIRSLHVALIPSLLTGMNPGAAVPAKGVLHDGLDGLHSPMPPLPALLLALGARLLSVPPGDLLAAAVLLVSMLYAAAFWVWIRSLPMSRPLREAACLVFLFLPIHNSYDGFDNIQTLLAGTICLGLVAAFNLALTTGRRRNLLAMMSCAVLLPLIRMEYLIFLPLFVACQALVFPLRAAVYSVRRYVVVSTLCFAGLAAGAAVEAGLRHGRPEDLGHSRAEYTCWTFLDGMPEAWLGENDHSEFGRRTVGIQRFGHPSKYGYSLSAMILANPGQTLAKTVLSIPRWFFHLGGRSQVLPLPAAMLAAAGILMLLVRSRSPRRRALLLHVVSLIACTTPLTGFMIYAEYMRPAWPAMCVLISYGVLCLARLLTKLTRAFFRRRTALRVVAAATCGGLVFCYFYSDAHYPDAPVLSPLAQAADQWNRKHAPARMLMAPYSHAIDAASHCAWWNRAAEQICLSQRGVSTTRAPSPQDVLDLYVCSAATGEEATAVFVWARGDDPSYLIDALRPWEQSGFVVIESRRIDISPNQSWAIALCLPPGE